MPRPPVGASPSFLVTIGTGFGTQAARQWPLRVLDTGPVAVFNAQISQILLTQTAGPACTPVLQTATPLGYGNIAPATSVSQPFTINFTGCANTVRFKVEAVVGAGPSSQTVTVANNQTM